MTISARIGVDRRWLAFEHMHWQCGEIKRRARPIFAKSGQYLCDVEGKISESLQGVRASRKMRSHLGATFAASANRVQCHTCAVRVRKMRGRPLNCVDIHSRCVPKIDQKRIFFRPFGLLNLFIFCCCYRLVVARISPFRLPAVVGCAHFTIFVSYLSHCVCSHERCAVILRCMPYICAAKRMVYHR